MKTLPAISASKTSGASGEVWLRINAFLSLKSPGTQHTYTGIIQEWCSFLGAEAGSKKAAELILQASDLHAIAYLNWLRGRQGQKPRLQRSRSPESNSKALAKRQKLSSKLDGLQETLANSTIRKKIACLRRVYRMLLSAKLGLQGNPFDSDRVPAPPSHSGEKRPTEMVEFKSVPEIISLPDISKPKGLRDAAILALLFGGGLRRSEVVSIRMGDLKRTQRGTVYVRLRSTKAKKDADQAIPAWAGKLLLALHEQRERSGASSGDFLFVSYRGPKGNVESRDPVSDSGIYKLFKRYCSLAGAKGHLSPHSARATSITKLLEQGFSHREVQEFSRHSSVQMVEVYDKRRVSIDENPGTDLDY